MHRSVIFFLLLSFTGAIVLLGGNGCANPIAPAGGPKDSLPPVLVAVTPKDSSENFNAKRVTFSFNEFVEVANVHDNLIVSPVPKIDPIVESKLRTVTVKIKDTLEANTTYSYDFGSAIKDINEGNILKNFTYVFSTGDHIDSLELTGQVQLAETGLADSTLIAMLHRNGDDSALIKEKPRFIAKLDSLGRFHFRHLPAGTFYLYAMKDESGQRKYLSRRQLFAFADAPVTITEKTAPVTIYAYVEKDTSKPFASTPVKAPVSKADKDKEKDKRLKFSINLENGQQDLLGKLELTFPEPLKTFDSTHVQFTDEAFKPVTGYRLYKDSSNKKITLAFKWPENSGFNLIVDRDFAEDSAGRKIPRTDTLKFRTMKESDYGNINIRFNNLDLAKKPVLQILSSGTVKDSARLTSRDFKIRLFRPGEYELRILYDSNGNGTWDAGEFFGKHRQPEVVRAIRRKLVVKANWDNDNTIDL
ncbi:MAG TPA: Ig-like domain-containing protein [Chitinophagaceae bacterium]|nr:Ig-like domain-containing protein [Chitinophagaceae bacterium]